MNFFERQDIARKQSGRLMLLFSLAVAAIVASVVTVVMIAVVAGEGVTEPGAFVGIALVVAVLTLGIIGLSSLYRVATLRSGGATVAQQLGGRPVPEDTTDFSLRRLRNVVEEIAIASGVPVPQIFVLEEEAGINAFAAGYAPTDAAVAVTRGALDKLNRDELQGVIAHEFSHILNGDMRLNIRLIGMLFGIMALAVIGKKVLSNVRGGSDSKGVVPILLIALALLIIGYAGVFFGRLIKAGVSRQREFLADASAVQFTRQTRGISGALKKIGGLVDGSALARKDGEEVSHMLFGDGFGLTSMFATHPPLLERIQHMEPNFRAEELTELAQRWMHSPPVGLDEDLALGLDGKRTAAVLPAERSEVTVTPPAVISQVAAPQADDYRRAGAITEAIPEVLRQAVQDREEVMPLLFGLLHAPPGPVRDHQQYELRARHDDRTARQSLDYAERVTELHRMLRLPLASLALPVLRRRPRAELEKFMDSCFALTHADGEVSPFEYCLGRLLRVQVRDALDPSHAWVPGNRRLADVAPHVVNMMAVLAMAGHDGPGEAQRAYLAGVAHVFPRMNSPYRPPPEPLRALDEAWPELDRVDPMGKELLIEGLVVAISHDQKVAVGEAELLRTVCASLHCPLPPMLEQLPSRLS